MEVKDSVVYLFNIINYLQLGVCTEKVLMNLLFVFNKQSAVVPYSLNTPKSLNSETTRGIFQMPCKEIGQFH